MSAVGFAWILGEASRPYGFCFTVEFVQNPTVLGRFVNRPYEICASTFNCANFYTCSGGHGDPPYGLRVILPRIVGTALAAVRFRESAETKW